MRISSRVCKAMSKRLFEAANHADLYAQFRPTYGQDVFDRIFAFCKETSSEFGLAVDVGCGSGQSSKPLAKRFQNVIGTDISANQIERAPVDIDNLTFRVGSAEDLGFLENVSTNLVTIAQAIHWVDTNKFYSEVNRVLKPGGSLVAFGYTNSILANKEAQHQVSTFYDGPLHGYWDEKRKHIDDNLATFSLPFPNWMRDDTLKIVKRWTVDEVVGYISSWSGWQAYLKAHPGSPALDDLKQRMKDIYSKSIDVDEEGRVYIEWPVFMLMGHKPARDA